MKKQGEFWAIPKLIMDRRDISLEARIAYAILWTRANGDNEAWPSQKYIAEILGVGERSIKRYIAELVKADLVTAKRRGDRKTNLYALSDGPIWPHRRASDVPSDGTKMSPVALREEYKIPITPATSVAEKDLADCIDLFRVVDPNWQRLFGRTNQRAAMKRMLESHGREKMEGIIKFLARNNGTPYAPKVTTPIQLEEKLGAMKSFWDQQREKQKSNTKLAPSMPS